jgi:hypothetical protein
MAILGDSGRLVLQRQPGLPATLLRTDLDVASSSVLLLDTAYQTGDQVTLSSADTLPLLGVGASSGTYWIRRDLLGRISFYPSPTAAINGRRDLQIRFNDAAWTELDIVQTLPPPQYVADILEWKLDLDAAAIDVTPIGVRFGENIKDLVTGAGSLRFQIERTNDDAVMNAIDTFNLLLLTQAGAKVSAQFWLLQDRPVIGCSELLPGSIYYECDILFVASSVTVTPDALIEGGVNFATTEEINLRIGV